MNTCWEFRKTKVTKFEIDAELWEGKYIWKKKLYFYYYGDMNTCQDFRKNKKLQNSGLMLSYEKVNTFEKIKILLRECGFQMVGVAP